MRHVFRARNRFAAPALALALALVPLSGAAAAAPATKPASSDTAVKPVDINTAGSAELTAIPGIGEAMAKRILDFRQAHGPFRRVEDLLQVQGIGEKSLEKLRPWVKVGKSD